MTDKTSEPQLWTPRSVAETVALYRDWASTYDKDVLASGYVTPMRLAKAMAETADLTQPVLDFGCGTGLSGQAMRDVGFKSIDGTDITQEMLEIAQGRGIYRKTWLSEPDTLSVAQNEYQTICATGVVSLGAAPASLLAILLAVLPAGGHLGFSYNDPTLADQSYQTALDTLIENGDASLIFREHGPHLLEKNMGSDVIILRKS